MYKIEKEVPISKAHSGRYRKYPWEEMQIGDSFFVAGLSTNSGGASIRARKKKGEDYTQRQVVENGVKGVRIWRIQ